MSRTSDIRTAPRGRRSPAIVVVALAVAIVAFAVVRAAAGPPDAGAQGGAAQPNVVVIQTDDQTLRDMEVMPRTREIMGAQGTTFANHYASFPLCCPARGTLLTGQYSHNTGIRGNTQPQGGYAALAPREKARTILPFALQQERSGVGMRTAHVGKYLNGYGQEKQPDGTVRPSPPAPGWTDWYGSTQAYRMWGMRAWEPGLAQPRQYGRLRVEDPENYTTDVQRRKAEEFVRGNAQRPYFLSVAFLAPHGEVGVKGAAASGNPRSAPRHREALPGAAAPKGGAYDERDLSDKPRWLREQLGDARISAQERARIDQRWRARQQSLLAVDEAVAGITSALRETGQLERTYVVFTADNGFFHGEHRIPGGKTLMYEPSSHLPLYVRGPGVAKGKTVRQLTSDVDLAPTILDMADRKATWRMDGRSLLPDARPGATPRPSRPVLHENEPRTGGGPADIDGDGEPEAVGAKLRIPQYRAVRTDRFLYVRWRDGSRGFANGSEELYDRARDPDELASKHRDPAYARTKAALRRELDRLAGCDGASCRATGRAVPGPRG